MNRALIISFSSSPYYEHLQHRLIEQCNAYGLEHISYTMDWIMHERSAYYKEHFDLLKEHRGAGYWSWKPYIMLDALSLVMENEIVVYLDASTLIKADPVPLIQSVKDIIVCDSSWVNHDWIKRDAFVLMGCDQEMYWNATQVWAGAVIVRNTPLSRFFLQHWLRFCEDRRIISDDPNTQGLPNLPSFRDHRHDQAVLTLLCTKFTKEMGYGTIELLPRVDMFQDE